LYEEAARGAAEHIAATVALGSLLTRNDRATEAIALIAPLLETRATHPIIASAAASAHGASGEHAQGLAITERALNEHPREPMLLATKARLHLATNQWQAALDALRIAIEVSPDDARLHTERGHAARGLGQLDEARAAFEAAIARDSRNVEALRSLLAVQLETRDFEGMPATFTRIDEAGASNLEVEQTRARYFVETNAGAGGIDPVRRARRETRRDKVLAYFLARLYLQAERFYDAIELFEEALPPEGPTERRNILLFRVLAFARARRGSTVEHLVEQLREGAAENPLTPEEEARLLVAEAWAARHDDAFGRAMPLLRRALNLHPNDTEALHLLGVIDEIQRRDPTARLRAAMSATPPSIEAMGRLSLLGEMDDEHCAWGQQYLRTAPEGGIASAVRERVRSSCARP
jgi:tetratricopeptide (TPR) repeat protein